MYLSSLLDKRDHAKAPEKKCAFKFSLIFTPQNQDEDGVSATKRD